ncbi:hypothetical protein [Polycladomyces subterraneus]|uniref:Uncharacterized protein n=1 Tax=Polycladomyces subterraneus TaxID=1016997 RepID=A0ABT8ILZ7_9BACL|nr:hypothetical protein [Polycladomyces subterraneus]MDN4593805.1 hypothetical protein [Polycladomyces subterraneus]
MNALGRLTWMEMKLFFREKQAVFWTFLFPRPDDLAVRLHVRQQKDAGRMELQ